MDYKHLVPSLSLNQSYSEREENNRAHFAPILNQGKVKANLLKECEQKY